MNLLLLAVLAPMLGAFVVLLIPAVFARLQLVAALCGSALGLVATIVAAADFAAPVASLQFVYKQTFAPDVGVALSLGIDGISLGFLLVSACMCFVALAVRGGQRVPGNTGPRQHSSIAMLLAQTALAGVYCSRDLVMFWCFWALFVTASFLLVGHSGGSRRLLTSAKVAISGFVSLGLLLGVLLYLGGQAHALTGHYDFDFDNITRVLLPLSSQYTAMFVTLLALALALPLAPLSGWWNDTHAQTSGFACPLLLLGPALYTFIKFLLPCFPLAAFHVLPLVAGVAAAGAAVGAITSAFDDDVRRKVAWVGCAQMAIAVVGLSSLGHAGLMGALLLAGTSGLSLGGLSLCLSDHPSEPSPSHPSDTFTAFLSRIFAYSAALLPGMGGFAAAFVALGGVAAVDRTQSAAGLPTPDFDVEPLWLIACCVFSALAVGSVLLAALRGKAGLSHTERLGYKAAPLCLVVVVLLALGVRPQAWFSHTEASVNQHVAQLHKKIVHANAAPQAPVHLFPNARSMLFSSSTAPTQPRHLPTLHRPPAGPIP